MLDPSLKNCHPLRLNQEFWYTIYMSFNSFLIQKYCINSRESPLSPTIIYANAHIHLSLTPQSSGGFSSQLHRWHLFALASREVRGLRMNCMAFRSTRKVYEQKLMSSKDLVTLDLFYCMTAQAYMRDKNNQRELFHRTTPFGSINCLKYFPNYTTESLVVCFSKPHQRQQIKL